MALGMVLAVQQVSHAQIIGNWTVKTGTFQLNESISGSFLVTGPVAADVHYRVVLQGTDFYGNAVTILLQSSDLPVLAGPAPNQPAQTATINFSGTIPNDGTLHGSNYTVALYTGDVLAGPPASLGNFKNSTSGISISVTPDIAIPNVQPVSKVRATATANLTGGAVSSLTIVNPGSGYDPSFPPLVTITGANTTPAIFLAVVEENTGSITRFQKVNGGAGYGAAPSVQVATPPTYQTERVGGLLYKSGNYYGGDILPIRTTVRNNPTADGTKQSRPLGPEDVHRLNVVLTTDPAYTATAGSDDYLIYFTEIVGDMAGAVGDLSTIRAVETYRTPGLLPAYGVPYTAGGGTYGERNYQPLPDDGYLDIGEQIDLQYEVLLPKNFDGIYYVAARADALNRIAEPIVTTVPTQETVTSEGAAVTVRNNNTVVSDIGARIRLLSGPSETTVPATQITDSNGYSVFQSDGASDMSAIDGRGRYVAFQSDAADLTIPADVAAEILAGLNLSTRGNLRWADLSAEQKAAFAAYVSNGLQQIYRRDTITSEIVAASVSSNGGLANKDAKNPALSTDGSSLAFESGADNISASDRNAASDIFVRSYGNVLRTAIVSVNKDGQQGNDGSYNASLSGTGRFVAFESQATNLDPSNPLPANQNNGMQIYVHDRDVSGSGVFDVAGNVRTYLASVTAIPSPGFIRATATANLVLTQVGSVTINTSGAGYIPTAPPAVIIDAPAAGAVGAVQATAEAVVGTMAPNIGKIIAIRITNPGWGYTSVPNVTISPLARPAGDTAAGANGWNEMANISEDGKYLTYVSYSANLPKTPGGTAVGDDGWRGIVYRIQLNNGIPMPETIEAVSVNGSSLANALAYEPVINGDGSVIAYTSWANNLVADDSNGVADVFARHLPTPSSPAAARFTKRVSESLNRLAVGSITFWGANVTPPASGDAITLDDGDTTVTFTFVAVAPAAPTEVAVGANASQTRDNLVRAINNYFRSTAGGFSIIAGNIPVDRLRTVNSGSNETILDALDLLEFTEPTPNSPANADPFYTAGSVGDAEQPMLLLINTKAGSIGNKEISGNFVLQESSAGFNYSLFPSGAGIITTGMQFGGRQADSDSGEYDGVLMGSMQPSIDRTGNTIAFRSTMQTLDVFDRTFTDANGLLKGEVLRMLRNGTSNIYVAKRDGVATSLTYGDTESTTRASVNRFGYPTYALLSTESSAANHKPAISANGRYVSFSSDSENNGGLIFGRTNLEPYDTNGYRDIFVRDLLTAVDLPDATTNNRPQVVLTEPSWLSGKKIGVGSVVTMTALATDLDETLNLENVTFIVNGMEVPATSRYGNYFTASFVATDLGSSNVITARVIDNSGADNNTTVSPALSFSVVSTIVQPTSITMLSPTLTSSPTVGQPINLSARVTLPFVGSTSLYAGGLVRFYANGVPIGDVAVPAGSSGYLAQLVWYPQSAGSVELSAIAVTYTNAFATTFPETWATLASNTLPAFLVAGPGVDATPGSPEAIALSLFQTVMRRPPNSAELAYYTAQLAAGTITPAGMVQLLITTSSYADADGNFWTGYIDTLNRLFDFHYRLGVAPSEYSFQARLANLTTPAASALSALPAAAVDTGLINPASPFGSTAGEAIAAQQIVMSPEFNAAWPGIPEYTNTNFLAWFQERLKLFGGNSTAYGTSANVVTGVMNANADSPLGSGVAFESAYYAAKDTAKYGAASPYQFQLKESALQWLFTGKWNAPTSLTTNINSNLLLSNVIIPLVATNQGITTWQWVNSYNLTTNNGGATNIPSGGAVDNLKAYAFNMNPTNNSGQTLATNGISGLPRPGGLTTNGLQYLTITYMRRHSSPSVSYSVEFAWDVNGPYTRATQPETVVAVDSMWDRVTVRDTVPTTSTNNTPTGDPLSRFGRVRLDASYWTPASP